MNVREILNEGSLWFPCKNYETQTPEVSVILPTYRRAKSGFFEKAVLSVINQKLTNWELIIVDDCSFDGTFELIKYFMENDTRISCIRHTKNIGLPAISTFEAYQKSRGKYIAFIFDDNEWDCEYLQKTVLYMERNKLKASYGIIRGYDKNDNYTDFGTENNLTCDLIWNNFIGNGGVMYHRDVVDEVGWYDPHVTLTRLCDWDLWRRIIKKFLFEATGIFAGKEWGVTLDDSLGNSVALSQLTSKEQVSFYRDDMLKPDKFMDYDIFSIPNNATDLYYESLKALVLQYEKKDWYDEKRIFSDIEKQNKIRKPRKRVFVLAAMMDATISLSFERYAENNNDIFFVMFPTNVLNMSEFAFADGVVIVRNLVDISKLINACRFFKIPMWYYIDDNFIELYKQNKKDITFKRAAGKLNYKELKCFEGVILSTQNLLEYFNDKNLHNTLYEIGPSIDLNNIKGFNEFNKNELTVAFMGGGVRVDILNKAVIPALEKMGESINIKFLYPKDRIDKKFVNMCKNIEFIPIKVDYYLPSALFRYMEYKPNILIQCGENNRNNKFKTENSLINAVQLGSVLITSDIEPYKSKDTVGTCFEISKNTIEGWYEKFKGILDEPKRARDLYENAHDYCVKLYNPKLLSDKINRIFKCLPNTNLGMTIMRFNDIYVDNFYGINRFALNSFDFNKPVRSLVGVPLMLDLLKGKVSFDVTCNVDNFSEIGLCFSAYGLCSGKLRISIFENNSKLREIIMEMNEYVRDFWTYFEFDTISGSMGKIYSIVLEPEYEDNSSYIGVYEDMSKRTFLYKVFYKLNGKHIKSRDVLCVDCRN